MQISFKSVYKIPLTDFSKLGRAKRNEFCKKYFDFIKSKYFLLEDEFLTLETKKKSDKKFNKLCKIFKFNFQKAD